VAGSFEALGLLEGARYLTVPLVAPQKVLRCEQISYF
jgi:hypothetical protein